MCVCLFLFLLGWEEVHFAIKYTCLHVTRKLFLMQIPPDDIRWEGEDPGISHKATGRSGAGRGVKKPTGRSSAVPGAGRGRGFVKNQSKKEFPASQNGIGKKSSGDIEIFHTDTLIKEVYNVDIRCF